MRVPVENIVPDRPDAVPSLFSRFRVYSQRVTPGVLLWIFGGRRDYRGKREVLEEQGDPPTPTPAVPRIVFSEVPCWRRRIPGRSQFLVVSGVDSQFLLPLPRRELPAQGMGYSILTSRAGQHDPHRALLLSEFPLPRGRRPRREKPLLPWLEQQGPADSLGLLTHLQAFLL
jgi:hypothetical protein